MKKILLFNLIFLYSAALFAAKEKVISPQIAGATIVSGTVITLEDPYFNTPGTTYTDISSKTLVTFGIDHTKLSAINFFISAAVNVRITYYTDKNSPPRFLPSATSSLPLTLEYNPAASNKEKDVLQLKGAYKIIVEVVGSTTINGEVASLADFFYLQAELEAERYYHFNINTVPFSATGNLSHSYDTGNNEITFSWTPLQGAESYEFEYAYTDDYSNEGLDSKKPLTELSYDFKNNSTRIAVNKASYTMPYVYDRGYILYRVRGTGKGGTDFKQTIYGKWSSDAFTSAANFTHVFPKGNELVQYENANWQFSSSFAEEGERKDVKTYFDGSLRNRQSVTKTNTENNLIVGETVYDYIGRPAVQIFPVPVVDPAISKGLHYVPGFNQNANGFPYSKMDFDTGSCITFTERLKENSGASLYYSPANPKKNEGHNAYIPSADGYPFTQVEYEPDNTGRVKRQSGPGPDFKLGSGHETKYFYGVPEQEQLDRLFGSEAGYCVHYKKNIVVDGNGQSSISYLDINDKVVATALIGEKPENLDGLPGVQAEEMTIGLIETCPADKPGCAVNNANKIIGNSLEITRELTVSNPGLYTFNYSITPTELNEVACGTSSTLVCYDCIYDLELELRDKCGELLKDSSGNVIQPIKKAIGNLDSLDITCSSDALVKESIECQLAVGSYTLIKRLTVHDASVNRYVNLHLANCTYTQAEINQRIELEKQELLEKGYSCDEMDCKQCELSVDTQFEVFKTLPENADTPEAELKLLFRYDEAKNECIELCEPESQCQASYQMMLSDLSPGGQYGATDPNAEDWTLSIYNEQNYLPGNGNGAGNYKYPLTSYVDEAGNSSYIPITVIETQNDDSITTVTFEPEITDSLELLWVIKDEFDVPRVISLEEAANYPEAYRAVYPRYLKNFSDFIINWQSSWAVSLDKFHPEYCYYEWCLNNSNPAGSFIYSSDAFDDRLQIIGSWEDALTEQPEKIVNAQGVLVDNPIYDPKFPGALMTADQATNLSDINFLLDRDPFFNSDGLGEASKQEMHNRLLNFSKSSSGSYLSLKEFAAITQRCEYQYHTLVGPECKAFGQDYYPNTTDTSKIAVNAEVRDGEWEMYRNSYLSEKQKIQRVLSDEYCTAKSNLDGGFNACIGNPKFKPHREKVRLKHFFKRSFWRPVVNRNQPCSQSFYSLYRGKTKRFTSDEELNTKLRICDTDDPIESARESKKKAELENYLATGQCPIVSELEHLLEAIVREGKLTTATPEPLSDYPAFSQTLYDLLKFNEEKEINWIDPTPYTHFQWSSSAQGSGLITKFTPQLNGHCNEIYFDFPATHYDYEGTQVKLEYKNIKSLRNLIYMKTTALGKHFKATVTVELHDAVTNANLGDQDVELQGYTCLPIDVCPDFTTVCETSPEAIDLENLLSAMASWDKDDGGVIGNELNAAARVLTGEKYGAEFSAHLKKYLGASVTGSWLYDASGTNPITIKVYDDNASDPEMTITLSSLKAISSVNNILAFSCVKGVTAGSAEFTLTAWYDPNITDDDLSDLIMVPFTGNVTLKNGTFQSLKCGPPIPEACKSIAYENAGSLEEFLDVLVGSSASGSNTIFLNNASTDISTNPAYLVGLQDQLPQKSNTLGNITIVNDKGDRDDTGRFLTADFCISSGTGCSPGGCGLKLSFLEKDETVRFSNIIGFEDLKPDHSSSSMSRNTFIITAIYKIGTQVYETPIRGESCFPVAICEFSCIAGKSTETHLQNGDFKDKTILTPTTGTGFSSDYMLTTGAPSTFQASLLMDAKTAYPSWQGKDHTLFKKTNFLAVRGEPGKRAWYTTVNVVEGKRYLFSSYLKGLSDNCSGLIINLYGTKVPADNCSEGNRNTDFNITIHNLGSDRWKKLALPKSWTATFTGPMEIGIMALSNTEACYNFGIDDVAFDGIDECTPSFSIFPDYPEPEDPQAKTPCEEHLDDMAHENVMIDIERQVFDKTENIRKAYIDKCLKAAENFYYTYTDKEYHYTLYYYDQAGNLIKTLPPSAVRALTNKADLEKVKTERKDTVLDPTVRPAHIFDLATIYEYNALNQLVKQNTPDGGTSRFWYDRLGRLVLSQNAKQITYAPKGYSYTRYDALGRIIEVGEALSNTDISAIQQVDDLTLKTLVNSGTRREITRTYYDTSITKSNIPGFIQERLRKRVSSSTYQDKEGTAYNHATHYSYDIHGNVKTLIQDYPGLEKFAQRYKRIDYDYDLVSGKVNQVSYQAGQADQFYHKYEYDADNRITNVYTTSLSSGRGDGGEVSGGREGILWDHDAQYSYYPHGPLARTELGDQKVQGIDYAYNLQGWIKGINSNALDPKKDIGKDGDPGGQRKQFARDAAAYSLDYYHNDYKPIGTLDVSTHFLARKNLDDLSDAAPELFNGNISSMVTSLSPFGTTGLPSEGWERSSGGGGAQLTAYRYDQLNRIKQMKAYQSLDLNTNTWTGSSTGKYKNNVSYDGNGNILSMHVNNSDASALDRMSYQYEWIDPADKSKGIKKNRLLHVNDSVSTTYADDIEDQGAFDVNNPSTWNYGYDAIGNLIKDKQEEIERIDWTVYGKIKSITRKTGSTKSDIEFAYDATGNRVMKLVKPRNSSGLQNEDTWTYTYYVRDASGNVMGTYEIQTNHSSGNQYASVFKAGEFHVYGSNRLGTFTPNKTISTYNFTASLSGGIFTNINGTTHLAIEDSVRKYKITGLKNYELSNHLGNVLAVISDKKDGIDDGTYDVNGQKINGTKDGLIDYYLANIKSTNDYYPGGALMPGRGYSSTSYRYGFNGKEKLDELHNNSGDVYDFGARIYDPRIGRWLSLDPSQKKYPSLSPYNAFENSPIYLNDPDGKDATVTIKGNTITVSTTIYIYGSGATQGTAKQMQNDIMNAWGNNGNGGNDWTYQDTETGQTYNVKFDVKVALYEDKEKNDPTFISESWDPSNTENFIEVGATLDDVGRSNVWLGDEGSWRGVGRDGQTLAQDDPAPHEFGHILGLDDRYTDDKGPDKGWETNIMGNSKTGKVEQRNINSVVEDAVKEYNSSDIKKHNDKNGNVKQDFVTKIDKAFVDK